MTKVLKVSSRTTSEWDTTDFLVVFLTEELLTMLKNGIKLLGEISASHGIDVIEFYNDAATFYNTGEYLAGDFCEVLDEFDTELLEEPEQTIRNGSISISKYQIVFKAYGKHTSEEFWGTVSHDVIMNVEL
jgi:hypothetical protein